MGLSSTTTANVAASPVHAPMFKLNNGNKISAVGFGTYQSKPEEVCNAVECALKVGYRHIDCAWKYVNEKDVGEGIRRSGVPRSDIFLTSKVWVTYHGRVEECLDQTLANLGVDYLDLYLIHWPVPLNPNGNDVFYPTLPDGRRDIDHSVSLSETWRQMEEMQKKGKVRAIGVSNFSQKTLEEEILPTAEIVPAVNQIELHLYNPQHKLIKYLKEKGIVPQAYSPLGSTNSPLMKDEVVLELAEKYRVSVADILLGYLLAKGIVILPKSVTPHRIAANYKGAVHAADILSESDIERLDSLAPNGKQKRFFMPSFGRDLGFDDWPKKDW
ncbi:hypothetical protein EW146_g3660 [Bondarzewia mesenterica]|uniref:NADP-dependent oxidoreductase domain-containing protein n=1 Tax=Bondarzewia mesenterica TaxID=1095465 RepID=A0A4V3XFD3_9AGAM|nr:hypothetical protein EW146_g3660 [Bondarzewia mesenterica]